MVNPEAAARVESARRWHDALGSNAPDWDDVEVVARLGVGSSTVAATMLWTDAKRLLGAWDDLQAALSASTSPTAPSAARPDPALSLADRGDPLTAGSEAGASEQAAAPHEDADEAAYTERRYRVLNDWLESAQSTGKNVTGVTREVLREIARARQADLFRYGSVIRNHQRELTQALDEVPPPVVDEDEAVPPEPAPGAASSAASTSSVPAAGGLGEVDPSGFATFQYPVEPVAPVEVPEVRFRIDDDGALEIVWPMGAGAAARLFRIVTSGESLELVRAAPDLGQALGATDESAWVERGAFDGRVRHVAVWLNEGPTEQEARAAQPVLWAVGSCVTPVRDVSIQEDEGTVYGQWPTVSGVERVDVLRVPADRIGTQDLQDFALPRTADGYRTGFADPNAEPGKDFVYMVYAVASVNDVAMQSPPVSQRVSIPARLPRITDLRAEHSTREGRPAIDLAWTMPDHLTATAVEVYLSEVPADREIGAQAIDRSALRRQGPLTEENRLRRSPIVEESSATMRGIVWPDGWSRAYLTIVTADDSRVQVGNTVQLTRAAPVSQVRLIERVDEQFLTFAWPAGAGLVKIYRTPLGTPLGDPERLRSIGELSDQQYQKYGGAHLAHPLPSEGCAVHLVTVTFARRAVEGGGRSTVEATYSEPVTVDYPGLTRIWYRLERVEEPRRGASPGHRLPPTSDGSWCGAIARRGYASRWVTMRAGCRCIPRMNARWAAMRSPSSRTSRWSSTTGSTSPISTGWSDSSSRAAPQRSKPASPCSTRRSNS